MGQWTEYSCEWRYGMSVEHVNSNHLMPLPYVRLSSRFSLFHGSQPSCVMFQLRGHVSYDPFVRP